MNRRMRALQALALALGYSASSEPTAAAPGCKRILGGCHIFSSSTSSSGARGGCASVLPPRRLGMPVIPAFGFADCSPVCFGEPRLVKPWSLGSQQSVAIGRPTPPLQNAIPCGEWPCPPNDLLAEVEHPWNQLKKRQTDPPKPASALSGARSTSQDDDVNRLPARQRVPDPAGIPQPVEDLAEGVGFEPTDGLPHLLISSQVP